MRKYFTFPLGVLLIALLIVIVVDVNLLVTPFSKQKIEIQGLSSKLFVEVEIADSSLKLQRGLMFREHLDKESGMLFVFKELSVRELWMKDTLLPLSAAFIDDNGVILNIVDMMPQTLDRHRSSGKTKYALEMNQG